MSRRRHPRGDALPIHVREALDEFDRAHGGVTPGEAWLTWRMLSRSPLLSLAARGYAAERAARVRLDGAYPLGSGWRLVPG